MLLGTNCIGPFLFTRLLHPILVTTAASSPHPGAVRVLWAASVVVDLQSPKGGLDVSNLDYKKKDEGSAVRYAISKAGNLFIGSEWSKRDSTNRVVHLVGLTIFAVSLLC
jgi:retinol dehydrogenase-12